MNPPPLFDIAVMILASGRIAYSVTSDEIFRPVREAVYRRSAPHGDTNRDGQLWRYIDVFKATERERERGEGKWIEEYREGLAPRDVGFWGGLLGCFYCFSFYTSLGIAAAYWLIGDAVIAPLSVFALWALANLYAKVLHS